MSKQKERSRDFRGSFDEDEQFINQLCFDSSYMDIDEKFFSNTNKKRNSIEVSSFSKSFSESIGLNLTSIPIQFKDPRFYHTTYTIEGQTLII